MKHWAAVSNAFAVDSESLSVRPLPVDRPALEVPSLAVITADGY